jgi:hypothetical protein
MPKQTSARKVGTSNLNGVSVELFELDAKTKDSGNKETKFTYQFPKFTEASTVEDLMKALEYTDSKKVVHSGLEVLRDYVNTALKNEKRSSKLAEINGILKLREDPEAAIKSMIDQMVLAYGVPREMAEANVRALIAQGSVNKPVETTEGTNAPTA